MFDFYSLLGSSLTVLIVLVLLIVFILFKTALVVPNQQAVVVERLGKFHAVLYAGFHILIPFIDSVAYRRSLKEDVLDVPKQTCITKDNVSVDIDGVLYLQVVNPEKSAYGISDYMFGSVQLAQTALRSAIGKLELDRTFEERNTINQEVVSALDLATAPWGIKVLRYEIRDITPPSGVMQAMEKQMRAEREKRALIAQSEGEMQARINMAEGSKAAAIAESEGKLQAMKNQAEGDAVLIRAVAQATADGLRLVADEMDKPGGTQAANLRIAENYIEQQARQGEQHHDPAHRSGERFRPRVQPDLGHQAGEGIIASNNGKAASAAFFCAVCGGASCRARDVLSAYASLFYSNMVRTRCVCGCNPRPGVSGGAFRTERGRTRFPGGSPSASSEVPNMEPCLPPASPCCCVSCGRIPRWGVPLPKLVPHAGRARLATAAPVFQRISVDDVAGRGYCRPKCRRG